jgi:hypothetical protein
MNVRDVEILTVKGLLVGTRGHAHQHKLRVT